MAENSDGTAAEESTDSDAEDQLPPDVADEAERLTRLARDAVDAAEAEAYREDRDSLLAEYGYTARIREEDRDTLVCYPAEWVEDGTVRTERIDDVDRGIERPLEGPGSADDWEAVDEYNREIVAQVADEHGGPHAENAEALADFAGNHYAKPIDDLTREEREEFLTEYFPRNAFPSDDQKAVVEESVQLAIEAAQDLE